MIKDHNPKKVYSELLTTNINTLKSKYGYSNTPAINNDITTKTNTLKFMFSNYELFTNKDTFNDNIIKLDSDITQLKSIVKSTYFRSIGIYENYLNNLEYDNKTTIPIKINPFQKLEYWGDDCNYDYINKQTRYKDISILQILKILLNTHKINKAIFKLSIARLKKNRPLPNKVKRFINCYLSTLKSSSRKNTLIALKRKSDNRVYDYVRVNNCTYRVYIKSAITLKLIKKYSDKRLKTEFEKRLINSNKLFFQNTHLSSK